MNVATGWWCSFRQFVERVRDGATAPGADVAQGGLGLRPENGQFVGILSETCPDYIALMHSLLAITVPFRPTQHRTSSNTPMRSRRQLGSLPVTPSFLPLALTLGLPADRIYLLEGENNGFTNYNQLVSSARKSGIPRLPIRDANKETCSSVSSAIMKYLARSMIAQRHGPLCRCLRARGQVAHR
ncbi:hypothetical protein DEU56DRAFT_43711 [Suillus clintonianus]|uniref:uncharacterized protein n=1 Tax=Suillus clintonianus TaxID=1904413 RepID=UPI001B868CFB|nr:uncharacterized protein DEU56DRAFT_43711 [Suillus clintonianus]KAG2123816.1 hypothetical protein DEU56DRAFT_43711 [Suillus clintonianus]